MLKEKSGIVYAEALAERDGDAYTYMIESDVGVDIRKSLFYTLAEKNWPLIGMEALGMSLEDIFITIVDKSNERKSLRGEKEKGYRPGRSGVEKQIAAGIMKNTAENQNKEEN
jgi:ABC-2 type transport system ATP-binding protein